MTFSRIPRHLLRTSLPSFCPVAFLTLLLTMGQFKPALAQTQPPLASAQSFAVLGYSTVTNTGSTVLTGDLGVSPGTAVTGFPPGIVTGGSIHAADATARQARADATTTYDDLKSQACNTTYSVPTDLGGKRLVPGVYCFASSAAITGTLTLDAGGDSSATFIFLMGSSLVTATDASVVLVNGAQRCEVFWQVGSSATLGTGTQLVGTVIALTSITLNTNAALSGRALALNGAVTLDSNTVAVTSCAAPVNPPVIGKSFNKPSITAGGNSTLTLTLSNPNSTAASITSVLTDTFPSGLLVSGKASTTCGGTVSAPIGHSALSLSGGAIPANGSCTITVAVTAPAAGAYINSVLAGALKTSNGNNVAPAVATLTVTPVVAPVLVPPTLGKSFSPATISAGGVSTLVLTLSNSNSVIDTMTAPLTDNLPAGMTVDGPASTTCGGMVDALVGSTVVTLTGGVLPAKGSCTVSVVVTSDSADSYYNSVAIGALKTSNGNNVAPAVATLTVTPVVTPVLVPPTLGKSFSPATISVNAVSTLVLTLSNSNSVIDTMTAPLTDHLPAGMTVDGPASTTCRGTVSAPIGSSSVSLTGGVIPAKGSCAISVGVTSGSAGSYHNSVGAGALKTSNGNNVAPAVATLTVTPVVTPVLVAPTLGKSFNPATVPEHGVSTLVLTLSNSNSVIDTMTAPLTDNLPAGMTVDGPASTTCGGCSYLNSVSAGALQTNNGKNAAPAVATLTATKAIPGGLPTVGKFFFPDEIKPGGSTTLTITLTNPDATAATLTAPFTDNLPSGVVVSGLPINVPDNTCGGTLSASKGSSSITLTGGKIPANSSCAITVHVAAQKAGTYVNWLHIGTLTTSNGSNAYQASASLLVSTSAGAGPHLLKSFSPSIIGNNGISTLTIRLSNSYASAAKLTAPLVDYMPAGMVVYGGASNTCGGVAKATPGTSILMLTGGAIPANGSCSVTVRVTAPCNNYFNNLAAGALQTSNGSSQEPAGASLTVNPD